MIEYRKATISDLDALVRIRLDFLRDADKIKSDEVIEVLLKNNREYMAASMADGSFVSWIAVEDDEIIATSGVTFYTLPPSPSNPIGKTAYISNMFTYPPYRKQGIATKLFDLSVQEAKANGITKVLLDATTMGRPLYEKYGFVAAENGMIYFAGNECKQGRKSLTN